MVGFGTLPFGLGHYGVGAVPATPDAPAAATGVAFIDQNGDYQTNGTGDLVKTTPTAQRAMLLLRTEVGSVIADSALGLSRQDAIDASWEYRMRRAIERALSPMVEDGTIRIDAITISLPLQFRASIVVEYTVLDSGSAEMVVL